MAFRRQIMDYLRIAGQLGNALLIKAGPNSLGQGQAVVQFWSGGADELYPGEITAINDGPNPGNNDSLFFLSPAKGATNGAGRGYLQLFARTSLYASSAQLGGDTAVVRGDTITLVPQTVSLPATTVKVMGSVEGVDTNGNAVPLAAGAGLNVTGNVHADGLSFNDGGSLGPSAPAGDYGLLASGGTAAGFKVGGLVITQSYTDTPPTNGLDVKGDTNLEGLVTSAGTYNRTSTFSANLGIAASPLGGIYRLTSSARYKREIRPHAIPAAAVLALQPRTYVDKAQADDAGGDTTGLPRHLGLIAEEVAKIPGLAELLVSYDEHGRPEAVAYDRVGVALIPLIQSLAARVADLEAGRP